jgi:hypothetical protein
MVQKMLPPNGRRAEALAEETGADKVGVMNIPGRKWTLVEKVDSAFLFAGVLTVASYFDRDTAHEVEIRSFANALYQRADLNWARDGGAMARS